MSIVTVGLPPQRKIELPRLCLFTDSAEPSGMGEHMLTLANELRHSYRISFVCPPTPGAVGFLQRARRLGVEVLALDAPYHDKASCAELRRWLTARRIDLFHAHAGIGWEGFGGIEAARAAGVPQIVRTEHLPYLLDHPVQREDHRRTVGYVQRLICVSEAARATYVAAGLPASKISVVQNGIPLYAAQVDRVAVRERLGLPSTAKMVLTVGRLVPQKGHDVLLAALPTVLAGHPAAHFVWAGEGPLQSELQAAIDNAGLTRNVHLLGRRSDVPELLAAADLFVLPSLFEGLPLSVLEAMAAGLAVVGTQVVGTSEAVQDGVTGRLVPAQNAPALADAICYTLNHPTIATAWGKAGREIVRRRFSAAHMAAATSAIYRELLGQQPFAAISSQSAVVSSQ